HESDYTAILYLPERLINSGARACNLFFQKQPSLKVHRQIERQLQKIIETYKLANYDISVAEYESLSHPITVYNVRFTAPGKEEDTGEPTPFIVGFAFAMLIYCFIFMYGIQVMRGVMEEKTNRIVEVIISSVRPFQLMLGKIVGVGLVSLTQFLVWVLLTATVFTVGQLVIISQYDASQLSPPSASMTQEIQQQLAEEAEDDILKPSNTNEFIQQIQKINFPLILSTFLFYFIGGYLLYASLFAAVGSAIDADTDTQQFMIPVTIPLVLAYIVAIFSALNPDGSMAQLFSQIPLTSPIVMMVRIPLVGISWAELLSSMLLLVAGFLFTTWLAARIYRTGILMYGKKVSYSEIWRWIRHHK
ncbi:MAG: ABC transporter permease, partial [Bacteroidota bacterium]